MPIYPKAESKRGQTVSPRTSARPARSKPRSSVSKARNNGFHIRMVFGFFKDYASLFLFAATAVGLIVIYNVFTASEVFALKRIEISQASPAVHDDVESLVRRTVGESRLMDIDLESIRQKVKTLPRLREVSVARVLPDKLFVEVNEREPAVLVRRSNGALVWLDTEAVEVGEFVIQPGSMQKVPPPAIGFAEGALTAGARTENRERVALYKQIEQEFASGDGLWNKVDEVDLNSTKYVNVRLANSTINVALGSENFRSRFETAVTVLKAVETVDVEQLSRYNVKDIEQVLANADSISFIYPAKNNGIVFNFSTPNSERRRSAGTQPKADLAKAEPPATAAARAETKKPSPVRSVAKKDAKNQAAKRTAASARGTSQVSKKQAPGKKR